VTKRSVTHATFVVERTYEASPARVFHAFADPAVKARWFGGADDWSGPETVFDFQVGGREHHRGKMEGQLHTFESRYWDIVPDERVVFAYDMLIDGARISVSLATVELTAEGTGTRLVFTEQGAFLDGFDSVDSREHGTGGLLDALGAELDRQAKEEA
jgi:uncharacterized protein YndB with AHSA1/START domain